MTTTKNDACPLPKGPLQAKRTCFGALSRRPALVVFLGSCFALCFLSLPRIISNLATMSLQPKKIQVPNGVKALIFLPGSVDIHIYIHHSLPNLCPSFPLSSVKTTSYDLHRHRQDSIYRNVTFRTWWSGVAKKRYKRNLHLCIFS